MTGTITPTERRAIHEQRYAQFLERVSTLPPREDPASRDDAQQRGADRTTGVDGGSFLAAALSYAWLSQLHKGGQYGIQDQASMAAIKRLAERYAAGLGGGTSHEYVPRVTEGDA
jgi:hypothetical protein